MEIINLGNLIVNNYLVNIDNTYILIDTGYPEGFEAFRKKLDTHNIKLSDIHYIFLTHAHDDHAGFLHEVISQTDATIILSEEAKERLLIGHNTWEGGCSGYIAKLFVLIMGLLGKSKHEYPKVEILENYILFNGTQQPFEELGIPLRIIRLPGHTKDSIGLYNKEVLFCGDAAMNGFPSVHNQIIWIESIDNYKASWKEMIQLDTKEVYPSHGKKFDKRKLVKNLKHLDNIKIRKIKVPTYN